MGSYTKVLADLHNEQVRSAELAVQVKTLQEVNTSANSRVAALQAEAVAEQKVAKYREQTTTREMHILQERVKLLEQIIRKTQKQLRGIVSACEAGTPGDEHDT